jgi:hypothetical protein
MPTVVLATPGLHHGHRTLDRHLLLGYPDEIFAYHARLLLVPLGRTRWVIASPALNVDQEDFLDEDIVPLSRQGLFPEASRPVFVSDRLNEVMKGALRARAAAIAEVLGVVVPAPGAGVAGDAQSIFSDTASGLFNTLVLADRLGGTGCKTIASKEIISWVVEGVEVSEFMERIRDRDRGAWVSEKRICCLDRLNVFQLGSSEYRCRRLSQIQTAERRSPRSPDLEGLEAFTSHSLDPSGGVLAVGFDRHVASVQTDEALILEQQRIAREERDTDKDRQPPAAPQKKGKGNDGKDEEA